MKEVLHLSHGIFYALLIATASAYLGSRVPLLGALLFAILLGAVVGNLVRVPRRASVAVSSLVIERLVG